MAKASTASLHIRGDITGSRGGSVDLWSDKSDFTLVGASSGAAIVPTSSNSTNDNNYYWSGYISVSSGEQAASTNPNLASALAALESALKALMGKLGQ